MKNYCRLNKTLTHYLLIIAMIVFGNNVLFAQIDEDDVNQNNQNTQDDKTLSPYFFIKSNDAANDQLPLKSTGATVSITGVIADVTISQVYCNNGKTPIEAIYVFPASTRAAVYSMEMRVGNRLLKAVIKEKEQARKDYEKAKDEGKSASLLEQQRPNVFQMNVANIMPGDTIEVLMKYTELLIPTDGVYEFVYPTVVGPRYSNKQQSTAQNSDKWVANPYTHSGELPLYEFKFAASINAGMAIKDFLCPTHDVKIEFTGSNSAICKITDKEKTAGNRDLILKYRLAGNKVESGLLLWKGEKENFFLAMVQPPQRPTISQIPGREYIFIIDVSGSMSGYPLDVSKELLKDLLSNLRTTDKFNILTFAGGADVLSEQSLDATPENLAKAIRMLESLNGSGGTELLPALKRAFAFPKPEGYSRSFVISTDGYVDVEQETFDFIRTNLNKANFFSFGIGSSVNRFIIEGMARVGCGEPFISINKEQAVANAAKFRKYIQTPVLTQITSSFDGFQAYDINPVSIPDVLAERPVLIFGKWKGDPKGSISVKGIGGEGNYEVKLALKDYTPDSKNLALQYLWARSVIQDLDDYNSVTGSEKNKETIIQMGLKYNLLTKYTSFVAIDSLVRNTTGKSTQVNQPLPLPQNVSDLAVGGNKSNFSNQRNISYGSVSTEDESLESYGTKRDIDFKTKEILTPKGQKQITDAPSHFIGGEAKLKEFIKNTMIYPQEAKTKNIQGKVVVQFTVDASGKIINIKIKKSIHPLLDNEAIRIIQQMPNWQPAFVKGVNADSNHKITIEFKL